jgi:Asp-tRNA(Asn)/Glu-tRNA(Gln) amidotransferase C subunit
MTPEQLQKLLNLTAIELPDDRKPAFLDYFNSMKDMFDDFASFPLPE